MNTITNKIIFNFCLILLLSISKNLMGQTIATGGFHTLIICNDSTIKAFGENASGQLGNGQTLDSNIPVAVTGLSSIIAVSGGGDQISAHSLALQQNGKVWSWGSNPFGGLGNGTLNGSLLPDTIPNLSNVKSISAGGWHSMALTNNGNIFTWGLNSDGQLGDSSIVDKLSPVQILSLHNIVAIASGTYHSLALKSNGTVWAWGDNTYGQIGNGDQIDQIKPVQVLNLTGVVKIAAGRFFSLALKNDGSLWAWGDNVYGQLGNASNTLSLVPVQVSNLGNSVASIGAGNFHSLAILNDSTVFSWGRNTNGNLGINSTSGSNIPVQMIGMSSAVGVAGGFNFTTVQKSDGTFWACGRNLSGQLGDGSFTQRNTLVQSTSLCPILQITSSLALPLQILHVSGKKLNSKNRIEWEAICDKTIQNFYVQYSDDGYSFIDLARIGNAALSQSCDQTFIYQFDHAMNTNQTHYYRIKQEDIDQQIHYSEVVKILAEANYESLNIFPNPIRSSFQIQLNRTSKCDVLISDMYGKLIYQKSDYKYGEIIQSNSWNEGIYFVHITQSGFTQTIKILK